MDSAQEPSEGEHSPANTPTSDVWPPELWENKFVVLNHPVYGNFFQQPYKANTLGTASQALPMYTPLLWLKCLNQAEDTELTHLTTKLGTIKSQSLP